MIAISPVITNLALIGACVIGIVTILWTLIRPPAQDGGSANVSVKGIKLRVTGRAITQMFLGAALLVSPILASNTVKAAVASTPPHTEVDIIPDPKYEAFVFMRDSSVLDLRGSKAQPLLSWLPKIGRKTNPATLVNSMLIRKVAAADAISFKYSTSGALDVRCLTHFCTVKHASTSSQYPGTDMADAWELTADVKEVPVGGDFQMIVEVTFWNAFDTPAKQWYATYSNNQTELENVSTLLIFPEASPFREYKLLTYSEADKTVRPFEGQMRVVPGAENQSLYWEIPNAHPSTTFRIEWY